MKDLVKGRLLTVKEVADFLQVSERWVQFHMKSGTLPFEWYSIGKRKHMVDSADLVSWFKGIKTPAGKEAPIPEKTMEKFVKAKKKLLKEENS